MLVVLVVAGPVGYEAYGVRMRGAHFADSGGPGPAAIWALLSSIRGRFDPRSSKPLRMIVSVVTQRGRLVNTAWLLKANKQRMKGGDGAEWRARMSTADRTKPHTGLV